jgi:hypothetical protein
MAILSFAWTSEAFIKGIKTKTRRRLKERQFNMWMKRYREKPNQIHTAVDKCLAWGGKRIGHFILTDYPYLEKLGNMPKEDLIAEGGMWDSVEEFIDFVNGTSGEIVAVLTFKKVDW